MTNTNARHAMFLHAHPDDESSKGAGTMARYAKDGARITVVTFTDGARGDILNPTLKARKDEILADLVRIRQEELAEALRILGVTDHVDLGYPDSGYVEDFDRDGSVLADDCFFNLPLRQVLQHLVPVIRETKPQVLVTYDENGGYPHPDHIQTHVATMAAHEAAADPAFMPEAGPPHRASKVYHQMTFTFRRLSLLQAECERRGIETPFAEWLERWDTSKPEEISAHIDVADHIGTRSAALKAHRTQVDPDGLWFSIPDDLIAQVYPWEDFHLAWSAPEVTVRLPEDDLFAGIPGLERPEPPQAVRRTT